MSMPFVPGTWYRVVVTIMDDTKTFQQQALETLDHKPYWYRFEGIYEDCLGGFLIFKVPPKDDPAGEPRRRMVLLGEIGWVDELQKTGDDNAQA